MIAGDDTKKEEKKDSFDLLSVSLTVDKRKVMEISSDMRLNWKKLLQKILLQKWLLQRNGLNLTRRQSKNC